MIRAVLFDIDGTLVDSNDLHVDAWAQVFAEAGHPVPRDRLHAQIGKGGDTFVPGVIPDLPAAERQALAHAHDRLFKRVFLPQVRPFPGAHDLLARVAADGRQVVLATSASGAELDHHLDLLDARGLVAASTSADDVENSKPAPDLFAAALRKAGVAADEAVAVGDTPYDIEGAAKAGIGTVALLSGGFTRADLAAADVIYDDVAALLADYAGSPLAR